MAMYDASNYNALDIKESSLVSSFSRIESTPFMFQDLPSDKFGSSRNNNFLSLKKIALDLAQSPEDRMNAVRYMSKIPYKNMIDHCIEACLPIIESENIPIGERIYFFSNNDPGYRLNSHIVKKCHEHYYAISKNNSHPLSFRLLSAQYIYLTEMHTLPIWQDVQQFIRNLATDKNESVKIRSEAADILCRKVDPEDYVIGKDTIKELGDLYNYNQISSIYSNSQNAHNETISESVMNAIRYLLSEKKNKDKTLEEGKKNDEITHTFSSDSTGKAEIVNKTIGNLHERLIQLCLTDERKDKIMTAFNWMLVYPARYEGATLIDILTLIWNKILQQDPSTKSELEKRLIEELSEMEQTCGTGYVTRLVNILSGFIKDEELQIKINVKDQLRSNILGRLAANLKLLPTKMQDLILEEMTSDKKKENIQEFIETYSVKEELQEEFISTKLISEETFNQIYDRTVKDFMGINTK